MGSPTSTTKTTTHLGPGKKHTTEQTVVHLFGKVDDPYAGVIDRDRFEELASFGCCFCSNQIDYHDVGTTIFAKDDVILCSDCSTDPEVNRILLPDLATVHAIARGAF